MTTWVCSPSQTIGTVLHQRLHGTLLHQRIHRIVLHQRLHRTVLYQRLNDPVLHHRVYVTVLHDRLHGSVLHQRIHGTVKWKISNTESGRNIRVFNKKTTYLQSDLARRCGAACTARPKSKREPKAKPSHQKFTLYHPDHSLAGVVRQTCSQPLSRHGYSFPYNSAFSLKED